MQLTPEHLSAIVAALPRFNVTEFAECDYDRDVAMRELLGHNVSEYNQTYKTSQINLAEQFYFYFFEAPKEELSAIAVYKLAECYEYNSSGSELWKDSNAQHWIKTLKHHAIASLPEYNSAKWTL
jgi:hypothetical protein